MPVPPPQRGEIRVRLVRTNDDAELTFQQADAARETAKDDSRARSQPISIARRCGFAPRFQRRTLGWRGS